jgi:hypothetical protein
MQTPLSLLPDLTTLTARITAALNGDGFSQPVTILERKAPLTMSTFPNEVVTCRLSDDRKLRVFIKYETGHGHRSYGHRRNIAYEAEVYRRVLHALQDFRPKCLGTHTDDKTGETWLIVEYLDRCVRLFDIIRKNETRTLRATARGARLIAQFHAAHESRAASGALSFLIRYDADYFRGWPRRTSEFAGPLRERFPWLTELCERSDEWLAPLLAAPQTVIHGEFYTKHILMRRKRMFFIDWESAALAAGEIDLAALTEGKEWSAEVVRRCEDEYKRARWPEGAPADFNRTLDAARMYLHFRWLGERPDWTVRAKSLWRYNYLHAVAKRLGLI